jgi:DNA polymerase III epsilon subunit-like protein
MKVLVFDTETTGLPTERNPSIMDVEKWPHIVQLSYILYDSETKQLLDMKDSLIKIPLDVEITPESEAIHHISRVMCQADGIDISEAINLFNKALDKAELIVGHNISFDKRMMMVECKRLNKYQRFTVNGTRKEEFCTMKKGSNICKIEVTSQTGEKYYKYPTLSELHLKLFDVLPNGTHNALADILICLRCYIKMTDDFDFVTDYDFPSHKLKNMYTEYCLS